MSFAIFFILAAFSIAAAVMVVLSKSPVSSALFLVLVMCFLAGLFVLLGALFLAAMQVIVYAGAIMVLFLFVIMLLSLRRDEYGPDPHIIQKYLGFALVAIILVQGIVVVGWAIKDYVATAPAIPTGEVPLDSVAVDYNSAGWVAKTLFTKYAYQFEITSILLLAALIGAVVIARKKRLPDIEGDGN